MIGWYGAVALVLLFVGVVLADIAFRNWLDLDDVSVRGLRRGDAAMQRRHKRVTRLCGWLGGGFATGALLLIALALLS